MNQCRQCGEQLSKKQYGESLRQMALCAPTGSVWHRHTGKIEKGKGGITWASSRGPLCPACLAKWLISPNK